MSNENTQLSTASSYNVNNIVFSKPQIGNIPNSIPPINFKRINISTVNPDGTVGELIFSTGRLFSFGVSENINLETGKNNGYVMSLCLWNKDGPTDEEKAFTDIFNLIVEKCKDHLIENREQIQHYELERNDLKKLDPLYWKKDKGKKIDGVGPVLYAKLIQSKKMNKIISIIHDEKNNLVDPLTLIGKYCYAKAAIKIESIFVGNKISLQIKLYEAEIKLLDTGMKRLLSFAPSVSVEKENVPPFNGNQNPQRVNEISESDSESDDDTQMLEIMKNIAAHQPNVQIQPAVASVQAKKPPVKKLSAK